VKTQDHKEIARHLMKEKSNLHNKKLKIFFILGNIAPDYNPFTYFRGSISKQFLGGHNYENINEYMKKLMLRISKCNYSEISRYYLLGKLIHYIADAFTFAHNKNFQGNIIQHCAYENELHKYISHSFNSNIEAPLCMINEENVMNHIEWLHKCYMEETMGCETDCRYINKSVKLIFDVFYRQPEIYLCTQLA